MDEDVWRQLEPGTAPPLQRLRAVRELVDAGIRAGVLMNPIVPGISSKPALLERTMKAIADHGARFVGCNVMFLEGGTRDHFMRWLAEEYPHLVDGYTGLYAGKYAPSPYRKEGSRTSSACCERKYRNESRGEEEERPRTGVQDEGPAMSKGKETAPDDEPPPRPAYFPLQRFLTVGEAGPSGPAHGSDLRLRPQSRPDRSTRPAAAPPLR